MPELLEWTQTCRPFGDYSHHTQGDKARLTSDSLAAARLSRCRRPSPSRRGRIRVKRPSLAHRFLLRTPDLCSRMEHICNARTTSSPRFKKLDCYNGAHETSSSSLACLSAPSHSGYSPAGKLRTPPMLASKILISAAVDVTPSIIFNSVAKNLNLYFWAKN